MVSDGLHTYRQVSIALIVLLWASLAAGLLLPAPLFLLQSFMQMGERTLASGALAVVTAALPLALAAGLYRQWHQAGRKRADTAAMSAELQCTPVLAAWGMPPLWK